MSTDTSAWWKGATADEASACKRVVEAFLQEPNPTHRCKFARALALFILLGGDDAEIRKTLDKTELQLDLVAEGLTDFKAMLSACGAVLSTNMQEAIKNLERRKQDRFDARIRRIQQTGKVIKLKGQR